MNRPVEDLVAEEMLLFTPTTGSFDVEAIAQALSGIVTHIATKSIRTPSLFSREPKLAMLVAHNDEQILAALFLMSYVWWFAAMNCWSTQSTHKMTYEFSPNNS